MTAEPLPPDVPAGQGCVDTQSVNAGGANIIEFPPATIAFTTPTAELSLEEPKPPVSQYTREPPLARADGPNSPVDQEALGDQSLIVGRDYDSASGQGIRETHDVPADRGPILADPFLGILAETVNDLEENRKALANRYRQLTRVGPDKDGKRRGFGMSESAPEVAIVRALLEALGGEKQKVFDEDRYKSDGTGGIEHQAVLKLNARMRKHPLWTSWGVHQKGVGEKQLARLLAAIGDPFWNGLHGRPRTVSELWSYCGLAVSHPVGQSGVAPHDDNAGGVAPKRQRGQKVNWSTDARMRAWNIAISCLKAKGGYAEVYYAAREKYVESVHPAVCVRCGPQGKPAAARSPLSDAHKHARAIRIVMKELLRDLWLAAKVLHETEPPPE